MVTYQPDGWHTVTPRIVARDPEKLVGFLKEVFDAKGEMRAASPAEIRIGDSVVMISGDGQRKPIPAFLYVYVGDTDATYRRAIAANATSLEEPADMPYGDRRAMVRDAWGNTWQIATRARMGKARSASKEVEGTQWVFEQSAIDWSELSNLYRIAPLGNKKPDDLKLAFSNSMYKCFVFEDGMLIGAGRAVADGVDCSYLCDVAIHPDFQGRGLGKAIIVKLKELSAGHRKIILYANPGKEGFYKKLGFMRMLTAMAIFQNQARAISGGLVDES